MAAADLLPPLALIPSGEFVMGSDEAAQTDEGPPHRVHLADYLISVQPITNADYATFVRDTNYRCPAIYELPVVVTASRQDRERTFRATGEPYVWRDSSPPRDRMDHPVTLVRHEDAAAYCAWLSSVSRRAVRLPTEAEWEKAARGGLKGKRYPWGDRLDPTLANFLSDPAQKASRGTTPCRSFPPNGYGLFDVAGNVWEWVQDWYDAGYYSVSPDRNPQGPARGHLRLVRGGAWLVSDVRMLTCSHRHKVPPDTYSYSIGFRIVCAPE